MLGLLNVFFLGTQVWFIGESGHFVRTEPASFFTLLVTALI